MKRFLISLILITSMLVGNAIPVAANDLAGREDESIFRLLNALRIFQGDDDGNFHPDDRINRAEYTAVVLRVMGLEDVALNYSKATSFEDVPSEHWASSYLALSRDMEIVEGIGGNVFGVTSDVIYRDAVKILVSALGYSVIAEQLGGYPNGYMNIASQLNITRNIIDDGDFTRADAAMLIYNALSVEILDNNYSMKSGDVLSAYHDMKIMYGTVTGVPGLHGNNHVQDGYVEISGVKYQTIGINVDDLMYADVKCYVKQENSDEPVICYITKRGESDGISVSAENIDVSSTLDNFVYLNENGRKSTVKLDSGMDIYVNSGIITSTYRTNEILKPDSGKVTLHDSDADGYYDLCIVESYRYVIAEYATENIVYDKYGNHINVANADEFSITYDGMPAEVSQIQKNDVVSVAESTDGQYVKLNICRDTISGEIATVTKNSAKPWSCIIVAESGAQTEAMVAKNYKDAVLAESPDAIGFKPGLKGVNVLLNQFGDICDIIYEETSSISNKSYAYIIGGGLGDDMSTAYFKVLTADNKLETYEANSKIIFGSLNGSTYSASRKNADAVLAELTENGEITAQPVRYVLDETEKITELYAAAPYNMSLEFSIDKPRGMVTYENGVLDGKYRINSDTIVFSVPDNPEDRSIMSSAKGTGFTDYSSYEVTLYDVVGNEITLMVVHNPVVKRYSGEQASYINTIDFGSAPVLYINETSYMMGEDGEEYIVVTGYQDGAEVTKYVSNIVMENPETSNLIRPGAAIQYSTNVNELKYAETANKPETIQTIIEAFNFSDHTDNGVLYEYDTKETENSKMMTVWGDITNATENYFTQRVHDPAQNQWLYFSSHLNIGTVILEYDAANEKFKPATIYDIVQGRQAFVRQSYSKTKEVVLY